MLIGGGGGSGGGINASNVATSGGRIGSGPLCGNTGNVLGGNGGTATNNVSNWQNVSANDCKCGSGGRGGRS